MYTKFIIGLGCLSVCAVVLAEGDITVRPSELDIELTPSAETFVLGEPVPVEVAVTNGNRSNFGYDDRSGGPGKTGLNLKLIHVDTGREVPLKGPWDGGAAFFIGPGETSTLRKDVNRRFGFEEAGSYQVSARYEAYMKLIWPGDEDYTELKTADSASNVAEFTILQVDLEKVARIQALLASGDEDDLDSGLALLWEAHVSVAKRCGPTLWRAIEHRRGRAKEQLVHYALGHASVQSAFVGEEQLVDTLLYASESANADVRLSAAQALGQMSAYWRRPKPLWDIYHERIPAWLDREDVAACREALMAALVGYTAYEVLPKVMLHDPAPQVRLAAARRLISLKPRQFLEVAAPLTDREEHVLIDGERVSLGSFIQSEMERLQLLFEQLDELDGRHRDNP